MNVRVLDDPAAVAAAAADLVAEAVMGGIRSLVLAGGSTPRRAYQLLAERPLPSWGRVAILFGDERCVPADDPESNYWMAHETLLERVHPGTVHRMPGELGAEAAAALYDGVVRASSPLDLVLLGIGPDGHTASLFPGNPALHATGGAVAVHDAPKPPPDRVTVTLEALRSARRVVLIVTGADKAEALCGAQRGDVPAGMIPGAEFLVDRAAAALLERP